MFSGIFNSDKAPCCSHARTCPSISWSFYERLPTIPSVFMPIPLIWWAIHAIFSRLPLRNWMILERQSIFSIFIAFIAIFFNIGPRVTVIFCSVPPKDVFHWVWEYPFPSPHPSICPSTTSSSPFTIIAIPVQPSASPATSLASLPRPSPFYSVSR